MKKSIKSMVNNLKAFASKTQLSFWKYGQVVTEQNMTTFSQDIYNKLGLITSNSTPFYSSVIGMQTWNRKFDLVKESSVTNLFSLNVFGWISCVFYPTSVPYLPNNYNAVQVVVTDSVSNKIMLTPLVVNYVYVKLTISPNSSGETNYDTTGSFVSFDTDQGEQPNLCLVAIIDTRTLVNNKPIEDYSKVCYLSNVGLYDNYTPYYLDKNDHYHSITPANLAYYSNIGVVAEYQNDITYEKGRQIRTYENNYGYIYWIASKHIASGAGIPTIADPKDWVQIYYIDIGGDIYFPGQLSTEDTIRCGGNFFVQDIDAKNIKSVNGFTDASILINNVYRKIGEDFTIDAIEGADATPVKLNAKYLGKKSIWIGWESWLDSNNNFVYIQALQLGGLTLTKAIPTMVLTSVEHNDSNLLYGINVSNGANLIKLTYNDATKGHYAYWSVIATLA